MNLEKKFHSLLVIGMIFAALTIMAACEEDEGPDPIIGDWDFKERICDEYGEMEVESDLEGTATLWFYYNGDCYYADFDFEIEIEKAGKEYVFDMECDGNCSELDFEMECELDGEDLECEGDGVWDSYEFEWEKD